MSNKFIFSGHETFHCRHFWLKKGYDFLKAGDNFKQDDAVVKLGVGKNMVASIRFWLRAFGLVDKKEKPNFFADFVFGEDGRDPYLEDPASLWLLHYNLIKNNFASIYSLVFNDFLRTRNEFTIEHLLNYIRRSTGHYFDFNEKTILRDINVFLKNYLMPIRKTKNLEEDFTGLLIELNIVQVLRDTHANKNAWYKIENINNENIPTEIILFVILNQMKGSSTVEINKLMNNRDNIGLIFVLNANALISHIKLIIKKYSGITFTEDAGTRVLQFREQFDKWDILNKYYEN